MTLNAQESEAFYKLMQRVNELQIRVTELELAGRSFWGFLPKWIREKLTEWPVPIKQDQLRLLFDTTPERNDPWEDDTTENGKPFRVIKGYHRGRPNGTES